MDITNPLIRNYLESVMPERNEALQELHEEAIRDDVPIIKHEMEQFIKFIISLHQPKRILEIGTAIGYSSIVMLSVAGSDTSIVTLEKSERMIPKAKKNFKTFGVESQVKLLEGDAVKTLKSLDEPFDLIFMDAAKGQYMNFYEDSHRLLKPGGLLIADNILQDGLIAKSRFAIPRRQRTIHGRMREFITLMSNHPEYTTSVLPIADGATISFKKKLIK